MRHVSCGCRNVRSSLAVRQTRSSCSIGIGSDLLHDGTYQTTSRRFSPSPIRRREISLISRTGSPCGIKSSPSPYASIIGGRTNHVSIAISSSISPLATRTVGPELRPGTESSVRVWVKPVVTTACSTLDTIRCLLWHTSCIMPNTSGAEQRDNLF